MIHKIKLLLLNKNGLSYNIIVQEKIMKNLLPKVRPEIGASIERSLTGRQDKAYIKEQMKKLDEENPVLHFWIKNFSKTTKDKNGAIFCGLIVFQMLRIQAECDRMLKEIKL